MKATWLGQDPDDDEVRWQLITFDTQRYIGVVIGDPFREFDGWQAYVQAAVKATALGTFNTSDGAKAVVELWWRRLLREKESK
jgi:hypothetical protein